MPIPGRLVVFTPNGTPLAGPLSVPDRDIEDLTGSEIQAFDHQIWTQTDKISDHYWWSDARRHEPIRIVKPLDKMTPLLYRYNTQGTFLPKVEIRWYRKEDKQKELAEWFRITLEHVLVTGVKTIKNNVKDPSFSRYSDYEELCFAYQRITWLRHKGYVYFTDEWNNGFFDGGSEKDLNYKASNYGETDDAAKKKNHTVSACGWDHQNDTRRGDSPDAVVNGDAILLQAEIDGNPPDGEEVRFEMYYREQDGQAVQFAKVYGKTKKSTAATEWKVDLSPIEKQQAKNNSKKPYTVTFEAIVDKKYGKPRPIKIESLKVTRCEGPTSAEVGLPALYTATAFNTEPSPEQKQSVCWQVKVGEHIHKTALNVGTSFTFAIPQTHAGDTITVHPYLNSPSDKVKVTTTVGPYLYFNGKELQLFDAAHKQTAAWPAVSGEKGEVDPTKEHGPIPNGKWIVRQAEVQQNPEMGIVDQFVENRVGGEWAGGEAVWGRQRVQIYALNAKTNGRLRFYIHGGKKAGSGFGIDLTDKIDDFMAQFRMLVKDVVLVVELNTQEIPAQTVKIDNEEFRTLVATVYGEAASCSECAWKAVAHVIMNRIGRYEWKTYKTALDIITKTGFDAYTQKTPLYLKAYKHLNGDKQEKSELIDRMAVVLEPVYKKTDVDNTGDSILYYSPKAQKALHKKIPKMYKEKPSWASSDLIEIVTVDGLLPTDDFEFFKYKHKG